MHLLRIEEAVGVLAVRVFDEHGHAAALFGEQIAADAAAVDLLGPCKQAFHFEHLVSVFIDESSVILQRMPSFSGFLEKIRKPFQPRAYIVHEEAAERVIVHEPRSKLRSEADPSSTTLDNRTFPIGLLGSRVEE